MVTALARFRGVLRRPQSVRWSLDLALAVVLFVATHAVFRGSTGHMQLCDSTYSLVVAETLLNRGTLDVSVCIPADPALRVKLPGYQPQGDLPYHLVRRGDAIFYGYPLGSTVLSLPFVYHYAQGKGLSSIGLDGIPDYTLEGLVQVRIAARVCAALAVLFYLLTRCYCSPAVSGLLAAGFAVGSPVWSTLSRALWSHTWMAFWVTVGVTLLVMARRISRVDQPAKPQAAPDGRSAKADLALGLALGTALFWAGFCRQHAAISAFAIGAYLLLHDRRLLAFTLLGGGIWTGGLVACSLAYFGTPLPPSVYGAGMIDGRDVLNRFAWLMISPTRGLLVYCPYLVVIAGVLFACRRHLTDATLLLPAGLAIGGHTLLLSCYTGWHANWAYGPRYFCDVLPWFVLTAALASNALAASTSRWKWLGVAMLGVAFAWGTFVHYRGANSEAAWFWNDRPRAVGDEAAVKEWRYPQFLTGITFRVRPNGSIEDL